MAPKRKQYKTARGKRFDMGEFAHSNQEKTAVGNMNVNAKGDVLGQGGHIKKTREEVVREYYHEAPTQEAQVSLKAEATPKDKMATATPLAETPVDTFISPEEAMQTLMDQQKGTFKKDELRPMTEDYPKSPKRGGPVGNVGKIKGGSEYAAPAKKEKE